MSDNMDFDDLNFDDLDLDGDGGFNDGQSGKNNAKNRNPITTVIGGFVSGIRRGLAPARPAGRLALLPTEPVRRQAAALPWPGAYVSSRRIVPFCERWVPACAGMTGWLVGGGTMLRHRHLVHLFLRLIFS